MSDTAASDTAARTPRVRRRSEGLELLGEFAGSGYRDPRYLVMRRDGQAAHLTKLLYFTLEALDGTRSDDEASAYVSSRIERELSTDGLAYLAETKLEPLGLLEVHDAAGRNVPGQARHSASDQHRAGSPKLPVARPLLALRLHATLVPARWVRRIAPVLSPLFYRPVIIAMLAALVATDIWFVRNADLGGALITVITQPTQVLLMVVIMIGGAVIHEFGHAAGCAHGGGRPGRIGVGLYLVFPAFYTDVTDSYRLSRAGRLRTDLGGVYFSGLVALGAALLLWLTGAPIWVLVIPLAQFELLEQLLPLVRLDGYFILTDLTGVPDLFGRIKPLLLSALPGRPAHPDIAGLQRRARIVVTSWVAIVVPALIVAFGVFLWQAPTIFRATLESVTLNWDGALLGWEAGSPVAVILSTLAGLVSTLPILGLIVLTFSVLRRAGRIVLQPIHRRSKKSLPST